MWDSGTGLGTVTHQTLGYLFPMGPYYWLMQTLGFPDWVAQRIWLGTILFAAGAGVLFLMRTHGLARRRARARAGMVVAAVRLHAVAVRPRLRGPHLGDPDAVRGAALAHRHGDARRPRRRMALARVVRGGHRARRWRQRDRAALRRHRSGAVVRLRHVGLARRSKCGGRSPRSGASARSRSGVSFWWIAGLWAQGKYGIPILRYTETYETVAKVSNAPELLRGLGYWFFYGDDKLGPWIEPSVAYTQHLWLIGAGYLLAIGGPARGGCVAVEAARLLRRVARDRHDHRGRLASRSTTRRRTGRSSPDSPIWTSGSRCGRRRAPVPLIVLSPRGDARRRHACARAVAPDRRSRGRGDDGCRRGDQPASALHRADARRTTCSAPRTSPSYWQQDARLPAVAGRRDPRARDAGRGLRVVPMGQHRRSRARPV